MMKSIRLRFLIAAVAVLLGTAIVRSQDTPASAPPPPMQGHGHEFGRGDHMMGFFADYLNLTDTQETQMKAVLQKEHGALKPLMEQMRQTRAQLRQYEEGTFDEAKVRAVAAQEAQNMVELTVEHTRVHNELFQLLTPEQQAKMKEFEARREARHEARMRKHTQEAPPPPAEN